MTNTLKLAFQQMESQAKQLPPSQNKGEANRMQIYARIIGEANRKQRTDSKQLPTSQNQGKSNCMQIYARIIGEANRIQRTVAGESDLS
jgi:hypothetical protein